MEIAPGRIIDDLRPGDFELREEGALQALEHHGRSLLRVGVESHAGTFVEGDAVDVKGPNGETIAKGLVRVSAESFKDGEDVVVHRDDLVLLRRP